MAKITKHEGPSNGGTPLAPDGTNYSTSSESAEKSEPSSSPDLQSPAPIAESQSSVEPTASSTVGSMDGDQTEAPALISEQEATKPVAPLRRRR
jgi:hypothetical protein